MRKLRSEPVIFKDPDNSPAELYEYFSTSHRRWEIHQAGIYHFRGRTPISVADNYEMIARDLGRARLFTPDWSFPTPFTGSNVRTLDESSRSTHCAERRAPHPPGTFVPNARRELINYRAHNVADVWGSRWSVTRAANARHEIRGDRLRATETNSASRVTRNRTATPSPCTRNYSSFN